MKVEYNEEMLEQEAINKYLNMIAYDYGGELARIFKEKYINKDKEIERLNNKNEELLTLYTTEREVKDYYKNIINELENWLNEKICLNKNDKDYVNGMTFVGVNLRMYQMFLDKLQELKGSDKE